MNIRNKQNRRVLRKLEWPKFIGLRRLVDETGKRLKGNNSIVKAKFIEQDANGKGVYRKADKTYVRGIAHSEAKALSLSESRSTSCACCGCDVGRDDEATVVTTMNGVFQGVSMTLCSTCEPIDKCITKVVQ